MDIILLFSKGDCLVPADKSTKSTSMIPMMTSYQ
jgi:hypothetical protein